MGVTHLKCDMHFVLVTTIIRCHGDKHAMCIPKNQPFFEDESMYSRKSQISSVIPQNEPKHGRYISNNPHVNTSLQFKHRYLPIFHSNTAVAMVTNAFF